MSITDQALMGLVTTGSNMTLNSIRTTIRSLRLETVISEREVGYNHAIKDILNIIEIYETVTAAKQAEVDQKLEETLSE
jgi:ribosomal protein L30/L7E